VDEVYAPFDALVGADGIFHGSARKLGPNVLAIGSLTKCFGLGLRRVGWVLAPEDLVASGEHALTLNVGTLPEAYARLALDSFQALPSLVSRTQQHLFGAASAKHPEPSKRELVNSWMEARPRFQWSCPDEGLFGFARCPWLPTTTPRVEEGIRTLGLIVGAGEFFGDCQGFRLAWSAPEDTLRQGLVFLDNLFSAPG
jgi:aspartate/methionine/tyrosine aminotransferase